MLWKKLHITIQFTSNKHVFAKCCQFLPHSVVVTKSNSSNDFTINIDNTKFELEYVNYDRLSVSEKGFIVYLRRYLLLLNNHQQRFELL